MVAVPAATPVTTPLLETVAIPVAELLQTPDGVASVNAVVLPTQTVLVPPIDAGVAGSGLIVNAFVTEFPQPVVTVYLTITVPAVSPVTTPPEVMLAVPVPATIDQVPPAVPLVKGAVAEFTHTESAPPAMPATVGTVLTVTVAFPDIDFEQVVVESLAKIISSNDEISFSASVEKKHTK